MLHCVSINHRTAGLDVLEKLSLEAPVALTTLGARSDVAGAVVLATCNRFEVYLDTGMLDALPAIAAATGLPQEVLRDHANSMHGEDAARHLFSVAAGLESVAIGEGEIAGQVSRALTTARESGLASSKLEVLFQSAVKTSRGVKSRTTLGGADRSLVRLALDLAASRFSDWSTRRVLLLGTGRYAATTVTALRDRGAADIAVFSPSGRAAAFSTRLGLRVAEDLPAGLAAADLIISCTSNEHHTITPDLVSAGHDRLIIDLGLPRNVHPDVARIAGVELLDLETIGLHAPLAELSSTADAREIVDSAAAEFAADTAIAPAVVALRQHVLSTLTAELDRRGPSTETAAALRHFAGVLLHAPSMRARELALEGRGEEFVAALNTLFGVSAELGVVGPAAADADGLSA